MCKAILVCDRLDANENLPQGMQVILEYIHEKLVPQLGKARHSWEMFVHEILAESDHLTSTFRESYVRRISLKHSQVLKQYLCNILIFLSKYVPAKVISIHAPAPWPAIRWKKTGKAVQTCLTSMPNVGICRCCFNGKWQCVESVIGIWLFWAFLSTVWKIRIHPNF